MKLSSGLALFSSVLMLFQSACFEIDEPEPEVIRSELAGEIVVQNSAFSTSRFARERHTQTRQVLNKLKSGEKVQLNDLMQTQSSSLEVTSDPRQATNTTPWIFDKKAFDFRAGELMVMSAYGKGDRQTMTSLVEKTLKSANKNNRFEVERCVLNTLCLVYVKDAEGHKLSQTDTHELSQAMNAHLTAELFRVSVNAYRYGMRVPNDQLFAQQWALEAAGLPAAWDITVGEPSVVVAVLDTGLRLQHPDINGQFVAGFDFITDPELSGDGGGPDPDPSDAGDQAFGNGQSSFHGSHVAGIVGARTDNTEGIAGAMWNGRIQPIRVLGRGLAGTDFDTLSGISWSVGGSVDGVPNNTTPAKIVNLSLGGPTNPDTSAIWTQLVTEIIDTRKADFGSPIFVTAAGNERSNAQNTIPASISGVITVAASRFDGTLAPYSNFGSVVDVIAPGGDISRDQNGDAQDDGIMSLFEDSYTLQQGTSMATPLVSGVLGLLLSIDPTIDQARALQLLRQSADPSGQCSSGCGAGALDATQLLIEGGGEVPDRPQLAVDRSRLIFQPDIERLPITIYNLGTETLEWTAEINERTDDVFALATSSGRVLAGATATTEVVLTRGAITSGRALITFEGQGLADGQNVFVELFFNDAAEPPQANLQVAQIDVFSVADNDSLNATGLSALARRSEGFVFEIKDVEPGRYVVFATGDDNNDGVFDSQRESFGAYPLVSNPSVIEVAAQQRVQGIAFSLQGGAIAGNGGVGAPCTTDDECLFAPDAECIIGFEGGYCSRICDDGFCGAGASCEELNCGDAPCNICLSTCLDENQCRSADGYICDAFGTCSPDGF